MSTRDSNNKRTLLPLDNEKINPPEDIETCPICYN